MRIFATDSYRYLTMISEQEKDILKVAVSKIVNNSLHSAIEREIARQMLAKFSREEK